MKEKSEEKQEKQERNNQKMKVVVNRSSSKVELIVEGKAVPLLAGQSIKVPDYVQIPSGVGLIVR